MNRLEKIFLLVATFCIVTSLISARRNKKWKSHENDDDKEIRFANNHTHHSHGKSSRSYWKTPYCGHLDNYYSKDSWFPQIFGWRDMIFDFGVGMDFDRFTWTVMQRHPDRKEAWGQRARAHLSNNSFIVMYFIRAYDNLIHNVDLYELCRSDSGIGWFQTFVREVNPASTWETDDMWPSDNFQ